MHKWAKEIADCVKTKVCGIGIDNLNPDNVSELKDWASIAKDVAELDYYYKIVEAMEKSGAEYGRDYDYHGKYYTPYNRMPEYRHNSMWDDERDIDREDMGRMYYSEHGNTLRNSGSMNQGHGQITGGKYGRSGMSRERYFSTKEDHMTSSNSDVQERQQKIDDYFKDLQKDIKEMYDDESGDMKQHMKQKLAYISSQLM